MSGWLSDVSYSSDGKRLDTIPSDSAAHYVRKIETAYEAYCELYGGTALQ